MTSELLATYHLLDGVAKTMGRVPVMTLSCTTFSGERRELPVSTTTSLRDLQQELCSLFHKPFPRTKASLTIEGLVYDEFIQQPFKTCGGRVVEAQVTFHPTDDPFFYDLRDRKMRPPRDELSPRPAPAFPALDDGTTLLLG